MRNIGTSALIVILAAGVTLLFLWAAFFWVPDTVWAQSKQAPPNDVAKLLTGVLVSCAGFLVVILVQPLKDGLIESVKNVAGLITLPACRIFVFGFPATGKTSLIRRLVALRQDGQEPSTRGFHVYEMTAPLNLESNQRIRVLLADYEGQSTDDLFVDPPAFFGLPGRRLVNVLVFLVDMFKEPPEPRRASETQGEYSKRLRVLVETRIDEDMQRYITPQEIKKAFKISGHGRGLCAVRLLVNKADILDGLEELLDGDSVESYVRKKFAKTITEISKQCEELKIGDKFSVRHISARTREGVDEFITEVLDLYQRYRGIESERRPAIHQLSNQ